MSITILVTGFGPFPGAPFNPTGPLVERLARLRRPALGDVKVIPHIFPTSYTVVDRELPRMLARYQPDALLMFGLASRAKTLRIETRARNVVALLPDAFGQSMRRNSIVSGGPTALALPVQARHLLTAARSARVPAKLSRDAGRYLCNYLCWRAAEAAKNGLCLAAFVHVPAVAHTRRRKAAHRHVTVDDLVRAGGRLLVATAIAARR
jgi:pyroglutamyl-peptidase